MGFFARLFKRNSANEPPISLALRTVVEGDNLTSRSNLYSALCQQRLILPVPKEPDNLERDARGRLTKSQRLNFLSFQDRSGRKFLAVFTNPEALTRWKSDAPKWIAVDTPALCRLAVDSGLSALQINPGNEPFVELSEDEMRMLAQRQVVT